MRKRLLYFLLLLSSLPATAGTAALLVGNAKYPLGSQQLPEIRNELPLVARSLRSFLDFDNLDIQYNLDSIPMKRELEKFIIGAGDSQGIKGKDFCYLHFSGHGIIRGSQILLLPSDSKYHRKSPTMLLDTCPLDQILRLIKEHDEVPTLVVIDCCLEGDEEQFELAKLTEDCPKNVCLVAPVSIGEQAPAKSLLNKELIRCLENNELKTWAAVANNLANPKEGFSPLIINPEALVSVTKTDTIDLDARDGIAFANFLDNFDPDTTPGGSKIHNALGQQFIFCPEGRCKTGSKPDEIGRNNDGREELFDRMISPNFLIGAREITQRDWKSVYRTNLLEQAGKAFNDTANYATINQKTIRDYLSAKTPTDLVLKENPELPMYWVNYHEAMEFCQELTRIDHDRGYLPKAWEYGLPTEWEWEYACRSGHFKSFDHAAELSERGWHFDNAFLDYEGAGLSRSLVKSNNPEGDRSGPHVTGLKLPNSWGLYDCLGNVWELCEREEDGDSGASINPRRGGSWLANAKFARPANRDQVESNFRFIDQGFRICLRKTGAGLDR